MSTSPNSLSKGKRLYRIAFGIWVVFALAASALFAFAPDRSIGYKAVIVTALLLSVVLLFSRNSTATTVVGVIALFGLLGTAPGACALSDPATQTEGLISLVCSIPCGFVWHAFLWSADVQAYLNSLTARNSDDRPEPRQ